MQRKRSLVAQRAGSPDFTKTSRSRFIDFDEALRLTTGKPPRSSPQSSVRRPSYAARRRAGLSNQSVSIELEKLCAVIGRARPVADQHARA